ncbi:MAG: hypothetical protein ACP5FK_00590 [bacterium]
MRNKKELPKLEELLEKYSRQWTYEDPIYRFYHQSIKVFHLQKSTEEILDVLQSLLLERKLNPWLLEIVKVGTGIESPWGKPELKTINEKWLENTKPIIEAFFHVRYFLEMMVKYGKELEYPPRHLPSGWAAILTLYQID